ncbi:MAG: hypothetical protein L0206_22010, partial [Actinobacteria bacterium]|nr:hypothetical protein [Actinomycetota bacterium]
GAWSRGERCGIDVIQVLSSWPKSARPELGGDAVLLEAGAMRARRDMMLPVTPCAGTCFAAEPRSDDGTIVEVDAIDARSRTRLLSSPVPSGLLRVPLERWAGRTVLLSVGSSPSIRAAARERVRLDRPRIEPCSCRSFVRLSDVLQSKQARIIHSTPDVRNRSIFLHPNPWAEARAEVAFPVIPCSGACFASGLHLGLGPDVGDGVAFTVDVLSGEDEIPLSYVAFGPDDPQRRIEASLEPWAGRAVSIRIGVEPGETPNWDWSSFVDPVVRPCQGGGGGSSE